jgi:hypothetical protein
MTKTTSRDAQTGRFVVGRDSGERFNAVEGLRASPRVARLQRESDAANENGAARRDRIRREFKK